MTSATTNNSTPIYCSESGNQLEDWYAVTLSDEQKEEAEMMRANAKARGIYSNLLQPVAFVICANSPSIRLAVLGISGWTLIKPSVMQFTAQFFRRTNLGG